MSTFNVDYVRAPQVEYNKPLTASFGPSSTVYLGPIGAGNYSLCVVGGQAHYATGKWFSSASVNPRVKVSDVSNAPYSASVGDWPLFNSEKTFFVIGEVQGVSYQVSGSGGMPYFGVAVVGAAGMSGTVYLLKS